MITILAAAAISVTINIGPKPKPPKVMCHKGAVSYVFKGKPGIKFSYEGRSYAIPQEGSIELVNDHGANNYVAAGQTTLIEAGSLDPFGTQTITISEEKEGVVNANNP